MRYIHCTYIVFVPNVRLYCKVDKRVSHRRFPKVDERVSHRRFPIAKPPARYSFTPFAIKHKGPWNKRGMTDPFARDGCLSHLQSFACLIRFLLDTMCRMFGIDFFFLRFAPSYTLSESHLRISDCPAHRVESSACFRRQ